MALLAGSVTVDSAGNATGTGLAKELYDAREASFAGSSVGGLQRVAAECNALASAIIDHVVANAQVVVTSVSGVTTGGGVSGPGTGTIT